MSATLEVLIRRLLERTASGQVKWSQGARDDIFIWSGSSASVVLTTEDGDGRAPFILQLLNDSGSVIEAERYAYVLNSDNDMTSVVGSLYDSARSTALDIQPTIQGLLDDLG